jgi:hypothetical protein
MVLAVPHRIWYCLLSIATACAPNHTWCEDWIERRVQSTEVKSPCFVQQRLSLHGKMSSCYTLGLYSTYGLRISKTDFTTEYTEWQWPLSGVHSIMMVKSAQPGENRECSPSFFTLSTISSKVVVYTKRADTLSLFLLYPYMYSADNTDRRAVLSPRRCVTAATKISERSSVQ